MSRETTDYFMFLAMRMIDGDWVDIKFNEGDGLRHPTKEERHFLESYKDKEVSIVSMNNGKKQAYKDILNSVEEDGLTYGDHYIPFSKSQRTGIIAVFSEELIEPIYSVVKMLAPE